MKYRPLFCAGFLIYSAGSLLAQTALVRHAATVNGAVEGSVRQMLGENATINSGGRVTGDLFVPGTPTITLNGTVNYGGTVEGSGSSSPTGYNVMVNGGVSLRHIVRRTDPISLPTVGAPPAPAGSRDVSINSPGQSAGDWSTVRNLTLNSNVGQFAVPAGTYGKFTANSGSGFTIGVAGATQPSVYNLQQLTLNGGAQFLVLGPVIVTVAGSVTFAGPAGSSNNPSWLLLQGAAGDVTLNSGGALYGYLTAPNSKLTLNSASQIVGGVTCDRLVINSNCLLRLVAPTAPNASPAVALTAPSGGASFTAPAAFTLAATASDSDGSVTKVEFYQGTTKLGEDTSAPYTLAISGLPAGSYSYLARGIDNLGASTDSTVTSIVVTNPNQPPTISLTAPGNGASYQAPVTVSLAATASDSDGFVAKVEFYQGTTKLGEDTDTPYQFTAASLAAGNYAFSARAYDNLGFTADSTTANITVTEPNQAPTVTLTAPANGASFIAPAEFLLTATASDLDGTVAKVEFYQDGAKIGEDTLAPFEATVSGLAVGAHHYLARAIDSSGLAVNSTSATITVVAPNTPPTVVLTAPVDGAGFTTPATINLSATASDSDGTVARVEFFNGSTKLGEAIMAPFAFTWTPVVAGTYVLGAKATDNTGATANSSPVIVTVVDNGVPFLANFEPAEGYLPGPLSGQKGWGVEGSASVVTTPVYGGEQAVSVLPGTPPALLVRAFDNADPRVTFVDVYAQPAVAITAADGVFFDTDSARVALTGTPPMGVLQAFNGDGNGGGAWFSTDKGPVIDATGKTVDWLRLTARADYTAKKWDLYFNGQMIAADLGFIDNTRTAFTSLGPSGHAARTTGFDDLLVAFDNPLFVDADRDGMDDAWESAHGLDLARNDRSDDLDGDGLTNVQEYILGTNPAVATNPADLDNNGLPDAWERQYFGHTGVMPAADPDNDGQTNYQEFQAGTNPLVADTAGGVLAVAMSAPQANAVAALGSDIVLSATVTGETGGVAKVEFFSGSTKLGESLSTPFQYTWAAAAEGQYEIHAQATDGSGQTAASTVLTVRVAAPLPLAVDFEAEEGFSSGALNGQKGWIASEGVSLTSESSWSGQVGVMLPASAVPASVTKYFPRPDSQPVAFADFAAGGKAAASAPEGLLFDMAGARVALVKNGTFAEFYTFDGNGQGAGSWRRVEYNYQIDLNADDSLQWVPEFGLRFDFTAKKWDLTVDGLVVAADLGLMDDSVGYLDRFTVYGSAAQPVTFDILQIGFENYSFTDADRDNMDDYWEEGNGLNPLLNDRNGDGDHDGLTNIHEFIAGTDLDNPDTDGDGLTDGFEVQHGLDPWTYTEPTDEDEDGLSQIQEAIDGTDPKDYFNGQVPRITVLSGEGSPTGEFVVLIHKPDGTPCPNAPVSFDVPASAAGLAGNPDSTITHQTITTRANADGIARVYLRPAASTP